MMSGVDSPVPGVRRVLAPNPSAMCAEGTNSYIVGQGAVAVIDPGPSIPAHVDALMAALKSGEQIVAICVTHSHLDHSGAAPLLAQRTDAPVCAFGGPTAGHSALMADLARRGLTYGGEGVDAAFTPDRILPDGGAVVFGDQHLTALWTPGHCGNHLCFMWGDICFSGDHVMGWASTLISPPDGDLTAYMHSLLRLEAASPGILLPGHGAPVTNPAARIAALRAHRLMREAEVINALRAGISTVTDLTRHIYTDTPAALIHAAERNVFAQLIDLVSRNVVRSVGELAFHADFSLKNAPETPAK